MDPLRLDDRRPFRRKVRRAPTDARRPLAARSDTQEEMLFEQRQRFCEAKERSSRYGSVFVLCHCLVMVVRHENVPRR